jgi:hypothetical protein
MVMIEEGNGILPARPLRINKIDEFELLLYGAFSR